MPRAESALAVLDVRLVWRLDAEMSLGVLSLPDRMRNAAVLTVLNRHATRRIGASPVFAELRQASWALQLARLALGSHQGTAGVEQFRDSPINMLVAAAPHAALETARVVLGSLLELPKDELDLLLGTFDAWVRASGSASVAGAALFCHPNTVRYRLRRIEAGTGRTLSNPAMSPSSSPRCAPGASCRTPNAVRHLERRRAATGGSPGIRWQGWRQQSAGFVTGSDGDVGAAGPGGTGCGVRPGLVSGLSGRAA